jgi:hypothetical protein
MEARRSPALEALANESRAAFERGDDNWFKEHAAMGEILISGTAPEEVARGREQVFGPEFSIEAARASLAQAKIDVQHGPIEAYEAGDAGFYIADDRFVLEDGSYVPVRNIGIAARDGDSWKLIGGFTSVLASNDLLAPGSGLAVKG